jgi:hypothetical protein
LNVKQISTKPVRHHHTGGYPAVVIHGSTDMRRVLAIGYPITLLSAPGAALYAGCGWWRALIEHARHAYPSSLFEDILDCADASGLALGALRAGQRRLVLTRTAPGWAAVAAIAQSLGGKVLGSRPPSLDMADAPTECRLHNWLQEQTTLGDSSDRLS